LKFGGEFLRLTFNFAQTQTAAGNYTFTQNFTASNPLTPAGGSGMASFLLGFPASGSAVTPAFAAGRQLYSAFFAQDDWKITRKLTLNLGVRWDLNSPWTERYNRLSFFNPNVPNPIAQQGGLNYNGAIGLVDTPADPSRHNILTNYHEFAPRIGLAFQLASKTVLRTGYGIFWVPNDDNYGALPSQDIVNTATTPYLATINNGITPAGNFSNPFPLGIIQPPGRNPSYQQSLFGQNVSAPLLNNPFGYAQQWNFDIQQQLGGGLLIDVAYGGAKGTHLPMSGLALDQLADRELSLGSQLLQQVPNPLYGLVQQGSLSAQTIPYGQLLRPYPQYNAVSFTGPNLGDSSYSSLQIKAEKRFAKGASILVAYTFSKLLSDTDPLTGWLETGGQGSIQDANNLRLERSVTSFDAPQRLVVSYVLDVPVGNGRKYLTHLSGVGNLLIGNWGFQGITTLQRGFPLHFTTSQNLTNSFGGGSRPNVNLAACPSGNGLSGSAEQRLNKWFNTSCFTQPAAFTFGDESRNDPVLRAEGETNFDLSLFKNFPFGPDGRLAIQFRAELFNLFNHPQFDLPGQTFGTAQFGVVSNQVNQPRLVQFAMRFRF
jgi:hypothetical protein